MGGVLMIRRYLEEHRQLLTRLFSFLVMVILTVFFALEFRHFDFQSFQTIIQRYNWLHLLGLAVVGYVSFLPSLGYDYLLAHAYRLSIANTEILSIALISQGLNNFITFGGSVGLKFRMDLYHKKHHIDSSVVIQISLLVSLASLLGLASYVLPSILYLGPIVPPALRVMAVFSLFVPLFFLSDTVARIPAVGRFLTRHHYLPLEFKVKTQLLLVALMDWASSGSFFVLVCHLLNPSLPIFHLFALYIVGQLVGILSFVPGGLGSFDLTILLLLKETGMHSTEAILAIFLFRLLYNIGPVLVSAIIYLYQFIRHQIGNGLFASSILANIMVLAGLINIFSVATPALETRYQILRQFLPPPLSLTAQYTTLLIGFTLLITSQGIRHRLKSAYQINMVLLPLSALFCLAKGFDYEEAIILLGFSFLLFSVRKIFSLPNLPFTKSTPLYTTLTTFVGATLFVLIYNTTHQVQFLRDNHAFSLAWFEKHRLTVLVSLLILGLALAVFLFTQKENLVFKPLNDAEIRRLKAFITKYPQKESSQSVNLRDKQFFLNKTGDGLLYYRPEGHFLVAMGNPLGEKNTSGRVVDEFIDYAYTHHMMPIFYGITAPNLVFFAGRDFTFVKVEETAMVGEIESYLFYPNDASLEDILTVLSSIR